MLLSPHYSCMYDYTGKENHLIMADSEFEKILNAKSSHNWTVMEVWVIDIGYEVWV